MGLAMVLVLMKLKEKLKTWWHSSTEKKKYRTYQKSGAEAYSISKWFAYKHLEFLSDKNAVRRCTEKGIDYTTVSIILFFH